jgi:flagella basal body P-ring formation protein FlgA
MKTFLKIALALLFLTMTLLVPAMAMTTAEAVREHMFALYELDPDQYQVDILSNPLKGVSINPGEFSLRPLTRSEPIGVFSIMATVKRDGEEDLTGQVRMRISRFESVLVATDRIQRADELTPEMAVLRRMDVTELREKALKDVDQLVGFQAGRNLRKGSILTTGDLAPIPDVERGHGLTIVYQSGLCRVTASGEAMQTGVAGDYIKVRNNATKKIITARVMDATEVMVDP